MDFPEKAIIGVIGDASAVIEEAKLLPGVRTIGSSDPLDLSPTRFLILDHALALRSRLERQQAAVQLSQLRLAGTSVLLISHDEELVESLCDEVWWGQHRGAPGEVLQAYRKQVAEEMRAWGAGQSPAISHALIHAKRRGDGRASIQTVELLGETGVATAVWKSGEAVTVRVAIRYATSVADPVVGMLIRTRIGLNVYGTNTELEQIHFGPCAANQTVMVNFAFGCELCPGEYTLTIASHDPDGVWHEWLEDAVAFSVSDSRYTAGVANLRARVSATGCVPGPD